MIAKRTLIKRMELLREHHCAKSEYTEGCCYCAPGTRCHSLLTVLIVLRNISDEVYEACTKESFLWDKYPNPPDKSNVAEGVFFAQPYGGRVPSIRTSDTSQDAAASIEDSLGELQWIVLDLVRKAGKRGITCDEVEVAANLRHQTASARLRELVLKNVICDTLMRRPTRSGRQAVVYRIKKQPNGETTHNGE